MKRAMSVGLAYVTLFGLYQLAWFTSVGLFSGFSLNLILLTDLC